MTELFLRAKHWQLFLLTFGLPLIFQVFIMTSVFSSLETGGEPDPTAMLTFMKFFPALMVVILFIFFGWYWSVGIGLQHLVPSTVKMKTGKFKVFFFTPLVYMIFICVAMSIMMSGMVGMAETGEEPPVGMILGSMAVIVPLHLFSIFCMFYCLYFVSKTLKTVELQRETTFSDFAGEFFMIWFFPIGIRFVQPKINQMIDGGGVQRGSIDGVIDR